MGRTASMLDRAEQGREGQGGGRLLCYYGDDFTGSTDVLESLFLAGLSAVLFLEPPTRELLEGRFRDVSCFGVAGISRSLSPERMERELRPIFETLKTAGAAVVHYKVCSTFDSSPAAGSIGKAMELGREVFGGSPYVPVLAGVPYLRRYTLFGNHFAAGSEDVYRLDRHPTMSRHPVTPMDEADLRLHLAKQTPLSVSLLDIRALDGPYEAVRQRLAAILEAERPDGLLFDVLDEPRLQTAGRLIWEAAADSEGSLFVVGSSGVEYALTACWRQNGLLPDAAPKPLQAAPAERLLVVSGSCSPITEKQIGRAAEAGFALVRVPAGELVHPDKAPAALAQLREEACALLASGRSVVLYSASGPGDASIALLREVLAEQGLQAEDSSRLLGRALGALTRELVAEAGLTRVLIAGGDTSGYITRELGIYALACKAALDPGAPLVTAYSTDARFEGLELVLKGGQVGGERFFEKVLLGSDPA
ncbi:four-carbon acid sugar kinase family protein [Paenibacillus puerhi]|uniref:four-carbon acid sugar kinase family protein n=1 Tax=Paenibacillus puerhi TaxID=2692622 RepID=UPI001F16C984|nr:four-carbon acid sugar kinase family protein [Paenibacillus puerhi]